MTAILKDPFILVDGSSYLFRAFYALPPLTNAQGKPTGAIYGVFNMLKKLIKTYEPKLMAIVFDAKGKTFRHEMYAPYKANRVAMPDDLAVQIEPLHKLIQAAGLPLLVVPGVEADDVIGTLAIKAKQQGLFTLISTGDKDLAQLVDDQIMLINTMTDTVYDEAKVIEKFGIGPKLMIDYLCLVGDSSDNIPGVPGVGPKTAVKWLTTYGSLDNIIKNVNNIKSKAGETLKATVELFPLLKELITIKTDVALQHTPDQLCLYSKDEDKLKEIFAELDFRSEETPKSIKKQYRAILKKEDFNKWLDSLKATKIFSIDLETTSLDYMQAEIVGIACAYREGEAVYIPVAHSYDGAPKQLDRNFVLEKMQSILEDSKYSKIGHNLKYDMEVFKNYDINLKGTLYDTMLESYVLNSVSSKHDMDTLAKKHLNYDTITFEDVAGKGVKQKTFDQIVLDEAVPYAAEDADITLRLHNKLFPDLLATDRLMQVFAEIDMPLVMVLVAMERRGVLIDVTKLKEQSKNFEEKLIKLGNQAHYLAKEAFNLNSPKQLQEILYKRQGLPILQKTPTGQPSTAEHVLQDLAMDFPLPKIILDYRSISKLKSTYTDRLPEQVDVDTGRIHTSYHQAVTTTGRLSSTNPNLQNIPIKTDDGKKIRRAFIAPEGYKILSADYSQIELRIMAHLSQDPGLINAFRQEQDIHLATAAEIFGVGLQNVSYQQRRNAKAINFGLIYGMSAFGLAKQLGIDRGEAEQYIDHYFKKFPNVRNFMEKTKKFAHEKGYVETLFGRRLYLPEIRSKNMSLRRAAERAAINAPMQGGQADIIKKAMINIHQWIHNNEEDFYMIMQVHDELVFEIPEGKVQYASEKIKNLMEQVVKLEVDLIVDVGIGNSWEKAH